MTDPHKDQAIPVKQAQSKIAAIILGVFIFITLALILGFMIIGISNQLRISDQQKVLYEIQTEISGSNLQDCLKGVSIYGLSLREALRWDQKRLIAKNPDNLVLYNVARRQLVEIEPLTKGSVLTFYTIDSEPLRDAERIHLARCVGLPESKLETKPHPSGHSR